MKSEVDEYQRLKKAKTSGPQISISRNDDGEIGTHSLERRQNSRNVLQISDSLVWRLCVQLG